MQTGKPSLTQWCPVQTYIVSIDFVKLMTKWYASWLFATRLQLGEHSKIGITKHTTALVCLVRFFVALFHYKQIYKSPKVTRLIKPEYFKSEIHISLRSLRANVKINKLLPQVTKSGPKLLISTDLLKIRLFMPILRLRLPLPQELLLFLGIFRSLTKWVYTKANLRWWLRI